jgi:hypothetical protein
MMQFVLQAGCAFAMKNGYGARGVPSLKNCYGARCAFSLNTGKKIGAMG